MMTRRDNLLACIRGEGPDRFVNQFEALELVRGNPMSASYLKDFAKTREGVNGWGVTIRWKEGVVAPFPVHDEAHKVIKDIFNWRESVKSPPLDFNEDDWAPYAEAASRIDRRERFAAVTVSPGIFEQMHYLMSIDDALINFYLAPEEMHDLVKYITDWELRFAEQLCRYVKPEVIMHHDDFGSQRSTFMSPDMTAEYFLDAYKQVYGYYKSHRVQLVIHHSDSYAATLVPMMIEMGVDIWQGCLTTNDLPELIRKYGGKMSFMGGINNGVVDVENWSREQIRAEVEKICAACGKNYFIPCMTGGGPGSTYPGVYQTVTEEIDRLNGLG